MRFLEHPIREYIVNWNDHLATFWVPIVVGLIFLGLAIRAIVDKNPMLCVIYLVLTCCCVGYLGFSDEIISKILNFVKS